MNVKEKKQAVVDKLSQKLSSATAFYLADFTGLNVKKVTELRARLRKAGVEYIVVKNTLAERAMVELGLPDITEFFKGPTAVVIGRQDPVEAAKVLSDFARENDNKPSLKAGIVEKRAVGTKDIDRLAKLPPREQLLAELAGAMQAPMAQLLFCLQSKLQETVGLLEALKAQRGE
ncbi:MAG: 50S ribosomal protein L10 [Longimicrobiales bacterium]